MKGRIAELGPLPTSAAQAAFSSRTARPRALIEHRRHGAPLSMGTPGALVEPAKTLLTSRAPAVLAQNSLSPHPTSFPLSACRLAASSGPRGLRDPDCVLSRARPWHLARHLAHGRLHKCGVPGSPFEA